MLRYRIVALVALAMLAILALPTGILAQGTTSINGVVFLSDAATLPSSAVITIQLADVTQAGAPAKVITERVFSTGGAQSPFSFSLPYSPQQISQNSRYIIQGNIRVAGQTLYRTMAPHTVNTSGTPSNNLQVTMVKVANSSLPQSSAGTQPLLLAGTLLLAAFAVMGLRRRLM
ncbi:MAG: YbaY family lipoprotein [Chloroflexales bacterium]|jgi:putative lipoprotein